MNKRGTRGMRLAASLNEAVEEADLGTSGQLSTDSVSPARIYDEIVTEPVLRQSTRKLFRDGHHKQAVEEAYKCLNNEVQRLSGSDRDGTTMMFTVFNEDDPTLVLDDFDGESKENQQAGYKHIFAGCIRGIRNPRAHEHEYVDETQDALEMLGWANHLLRVAQKANRGQIQKTNE